jgi:hypothetical protein
MLERRRILSIGALSSNSRGSQNGESRTEPAALLNGMPEAVVQAAVAMLEDPHLMDRVVEDAHALGLAGEDDLIQQVYLTGVSRLLPRPLACIVQGLSSSGKDFVKNIVVRLFSPEAIYDADQLTPQALFYMPPGTLVHRFVVLGERSRARNTEVTRALREMLSQGRLSKSRPVWNNGQLETKKIEQEGPIAFIETTSLTNVFCEDANRCVLQMTDESSEQTQRILMTMANLAAGGRLVEEENIVQRHHALQRLLKTYAVVIPYAEQLASRFPCNRVEARRAFGHVLRMIQASALLHQKQREKDERGQLLANADDYALARRLLAEPLARQLRGKLPAGTLALLRGLIDSYGVQRLNFRVTDVIQKVANSSSPELAGSTSTVYQRIAELRDNGLLEVVGVHVGSQSARYQVASAAVDYAPVLPSVHEVCGVFPRNSGDEG